MLFDIFKRKKQGALSAEAVCALVESYIASQGLRDAPSQEHRNLLAYLEHYKTRQVLDSYYALVDGFSSHAKLPKSFSALDYGCWYGLSSVVIASCAARTVGVDINPESVRQARGFAEWAGLATVRFDSASAVTEGSYVNAFHAAFIVDVLCSAHPDDSSTILGALAATVMDNGYLFIKDANNTRDPASKPMLQARWYDYEVGKGSPDRPQGYYYRLRKDHLRVAFPALPLHQLDELARDTCYLWGTGLTEHARRMVAGVAAPQRFDPNSERPPVQATDGCTFGTLLDPLRIIDDLRGQGLIVSLYRSLLEEPVSSAQEAAYVTPHFFIVGHKKR